ncbi:MAG: ATP-dependent DNA helicase RecG [Sphingobacteriia bacterium]|nr:ATP-dependent DNA helicase RecG [Sphingobacteriia bacterium]
MSSSILDTDISFLRGVGPAKAQLMKADLSISTFGDLLYLFPFRYVDRSKINTINEIRSDDHFYQIIGTVVGMQTIGVGRGMRLNVSVQDRSGSIDLVWFQGIKWIKALLKPGDSYLIFGKPSSFNGKYSIVHPDIEVANEQSITLSTGLQPVYSSTEKLKSKGLDSRGLARLMRTLFEEIASRIEEIIPDDILQQYRLLPRAHAFWNIHFPQNNYLLDQARRRLKFEELLLVQLDLLKLKLKRTGLGVGHAFPVVGEMFNKCYSEVLPFGLTNAQKKVIREIRKDLYGQKQMNRLLQGDVGSGKTIVSFLVMLIAIDNGFQACLMAPTEILAQQHYVSIKKLADQLDLSIALITGSVPQSARKPILASLESGELKILIGTHALLEEVVKFNNLGIAVIDEQHRFGVQQRASLWSKNSIPPHILVMTATPIPRTLAMTLYGDLDVSIIDELPPGRKPIQTRHFKDAQRLIVFHFMKTQIALGRQVYVVYPLIDESETLDLKHLTEGFEAISREFPLPDFAISMVHGQLKPAEKEYEMARFKKGETQIMVATTVIEVGVDVPNASVMVIENAERFGLSQLHQLRGRVGRGADQSFCLLMTADKISPDAKSRIETMVRTNNGFEIAEADLEIRGPGDLSGTRQSGMIELKMANLLTDGPILEAARNKAFEILTQDPELKLPVNSGLKERLERLSPDRKDWSRVS